METNVQSKNEEGGSNSQKVESVTQTDDDYISSYETTILLAKCTNDYTQITPSNTPTQKDKVESVTQTDDDYISSYETTILYKNAKIETPTK